MVVDDMWYLLKVQMCTMRKINKIYALKIKMLLFLLLTKKNPVLTTLAENLLCSWYAT